MAGLVKGKTDGFYPFPTENLGCYKLQHAVCGPGETGLGGLQSKVSVALTCWVVPSIPQHWHGGSARGIFPEGGREMRVNLRRGKHLGR